MPWERAFSVLDQVFAFGARLTGRGGSVAVPVAVAVILPVAGR